MIELTSVIVSIVGLEPVGEAVVVIIGIDDVCDAVIVVVVSPITVGTIELIYV